MRVAGCKKSGLLWGAVGLEVLRGEVGGVVRLRASGWAVTDGLVRGKQGSRSGWLRMSRRGRRGYTTDGMMKWRSMKSSGFCFEVRLRVGYDSERASVGFSG